MLTRHIIGGPRRPIVSNCLVTRFLSSWSPQPYTGGGQPTSNGLKRQCFFMQFENQNLDQYLKDHETVWPDMQEALVRCGWHNYSLFYRPDGFAVGYFETDSSFEDAASKMEDEEGNTRWQEGMSKYTPSGVRPDQAFGTMEHYFYLGTDTSKASIPVTAKTDWSPQTYTGGGQPTANGLKRQCFFMQFENQNLDQYLKDHETVWPDMQEALVRCGWHNYSLFYRPDGFAVGYFETD